MHPLGCLPLWGREGVTFQITNKRKQMIKKQDLNSATIFMILK
jgi:hypothetical protein